MTLERALLFTELMLGSSPRFTAVQNADSKASKPLARVLAARAALCCCAGECARLHKAHPEKESVYNA